MKKMTLHGATISFNGIEIPGKRDVELLVDDTPKVWDITPPQGWNWTEDDWRIFNFCRDLDFRGGVVSGGLFDQYVLIQYNRKKPSKSLIIIERVMADWTKEKVNMPDHPFPQHAKCRSVVTIPDDDFELPSYAAIYRKQP